MPGKTKVTTNRRLESISNGNMKVSFDKTSGKLISIRNSVTGNEYLNGSIKPRIPFAIYHDFTRDYEISRDDNDGVFKIGDDPAEISNKVFSPSKVNCNSFSKTKKANSSILKIVYIDDESQLKAELKIQLKNNNSSIWSLKLTNIGKLSKPIMGVFPFFSGLKLGDGKNNSMVVNNQAGYVLPLWSENGGIYGNSLQMSMQWGCVFDDTTKDAFGFIVKDPNLKNKEIAYKKPNIEVRYFPIQTVKPGETITFPNVEIMVYTGDWKPTAVAYRNWFSRAFKPIKHPEWVRQMDGHLGQWFHKHGQETSANHGIGEEAKSLMNPMDNFKELPDVYRRLPVDTIEFAFHCRSSMGKNRSGKIFTHTDGDNVIREDLGGASALKKGIDLAHRLGFHFTFYIEGYICPADSDLFIKGKAEEWIVMNKDGSNSGRYTKINPEKNWRHMCPGSKGWQNHLAKTAARLVRQTGADGIRLDSSGHYFFPCYNPKHNHKSPFDFNVWMCELLEKVAKAVKKVNPNCVLLTEAGSDFYSQYFNGGLTQPLNDSQVAVSRDVAPMRIAVPEFFTIAHNPCGPVAASLMGYPGGCGGITPGGYFSELDEKWRSARFAVGNIIRWGNAANENPKANRADVVCRRFDSNGMDVIIAARPILKKRKINNDPNTLNLDVDLKKNVVTFQIKIDNIKKVPARAYLYDIDKLSVEEVDFVVSKDKSGIEITVSSNWFMIILSAKPCPLATIDLPEILTPGKVYDVPLSLLGAKKKSLKGVLSAPGLECSDIGKNGLAVNIPGTVKLTIPKTLPDGKYLITLYGDRFLGCKRFVEIKK